MWSGTRLSFTVLPSVEKLVPSEQGCYWVEIDWLFVLGSGDPIAEVWEPPCVWKGPGAPSSRPGTYPELVEDSDVIVYSSVLCLSVAMVLCRFA